MSYSSQLEKVGNAYCTFSQPKTCLTFLYFYQEITILKFFEVKSSDNNKKISKAKANHNLLRNVAQLITPTFLFPSACLHKDLKPDVC